MVKKYVAICLCVLAVCAVFGLNARTDYEDIKFAFESVSESANTIVDDVTIVDCFAYVFEDFRIGQITRINYYGYMDSEFMGTGYIIGIYVYDGTGAGERFFSFATEETALRVTNALAPLTWNFESEEPQNFWGNIISGVTNALNAIVLVLGIIFALIQTIFVFVTDAISTAWSTVAACLYVLGFPIRL